MPLKASTIFCHTLKGKFLQESSIFIQFVLLFIYREQNKHSYSRWNLIQVFHPVI